VRVQILPVDADDSVVVEAVRQWAELLAADDFEAAVAFLHHGHGANRMAGSAPDLRAWLARYEPAAPIPPAPARVTSPQTADDTFEPLQEVFRRDDGTITSVDFSLPINGMWSELVAFFDAVPVPGGLALQLRDMYVA
jgi:hypothetical protein